jgi:hypothetical protein
MGKTLKGTFIDVPPSPHAWVKQTRLGNSVKDTPTIPTCMGKTPTDGITLLLIPQWIVEKAQLAVGMVT